MKLLRLFIGLSLGLSLSLACLLVLALAVGQMLPYPVELAYISTIRSRDPYKLYLMDVQRQYSVMLGSATNNCCLTWSPDGNILVYIRFISSEGRFEIFSTDLHSPVRQLTDTKIPKGQPAFSPDGQQIVYMSSPLDKFQLYLMNSDGSHHRVLNGYPSPERPTSRPVWAIDGHSILFSDTTKPYSLLSLPLDCLVACENAVQPVYDTNALPLAIIEFIPLDKSRLLMAAFDQTRQGNYRQDNYYIYALDTDTTNPPERLALNPDIDTPAMSRYDHWIAFTSGTTDLDFSGPIGDLSLFILDANCIGTKSGCAGSIQKVANHLRSGEKVSWSSDGRWLVFVTVESNNTKVRLNLLDTTCFMRHQDCSGYIHPLPPMPMHYMIPALRPHIQ